jgi:hypothetical protein
MVDLETIPQETRERVEQIGSADIVIGVVSPTTNDTVPHLVGSVREALSALSAPAKTAIVLTAYTPDKSSNNGQFLESKEDSSLCILPYSLTSADLSTPPAQNIGSAYRAIASVGQTLNVRSCAIMASNIEVLGAKWINHLVQPVLESQYDLVAPNYSRYRFSGLLNSSVIYPLTRALYGKRVQHPLGPDFGFSSRQMQSILMSQAGSASQRTRPLPLVTVEAVMAGFQICEAFLGDRRTAAPDWTNVSSVLAQFIGPLFLDMERNASFWQKIRNSQPIAKYGESMPVQEESPGPDVRRLIESFQFGSRNLQEIWSQLLPPATLLELKKLSVMAPDRFRMSDELWARIVYDLALGYRLRSIGRDHLLRAMTPLYLGWVASYAIETEGSRPVMVEQRLERLCAAYEREKPYLLSRWRWPDRFNP